MLKKNHLIINFKSDKNYYSTGKKKKYIYIYIETLTKSVFNYKNFKIDKK